VSTYPVLRLALTLYNTLLLVAFSFSRIASGTSGPFYIDNSAIGSDLALTT